MNTPVVLITGGVIGIGRAAAIAFAKKGAKVVVAGRRDDAGKALVTELRSFGPAPRPGERSSVSPALPPYGTAQGLASQMPAAYSAMVRSLENVPELARFAIAFRVQPSGSAESSSNRRSASR